MTRQGGRLLVVIAAVAQLLLASVSFADDLGSMQQGLITPDLWRKFYKPSYKKYCDLIHEGGAKSWMHSDGAIDEIIPDLIEVGLDILDPVQAECVDIEAVAPVVKGRLVIWGGMDSHLMAGGTYEQVRTHAEGTSAVPSVHRRQIIQRDQDQACGELAGSESDEPASEGTSWSR